MYYNGKKKTSKKMSNVDYVVIDELTKFKRTRTKLNNSLTYMPREKNNNPIKK
jgi:macrodomain Ter protein organizer (MatP/YcbG family)